MRDFGRILTAVALLWCGAAAAADVRVNFVEPEHYRDANLYRDYGKTAKEPTMRAIEALFARLADKNLPKDARLTIDVLDIDLAGRFEPWQFNYQDVRFMRDITWPSMKLRYRLEGGADAPLEGEETVSDKSYLTQPAILSHLDAMEYDKTMLERWFRQRLVERRPAPR